jgi:hypothetical protein
VLTLIESVSASRTIVALAKVLLKAPTEKTDGIDDRLHAVIDGVKRGEKTIGVCPSYDLITGTPPVLDQPRYLHGSRPGVDKTVVYIEREPLTDTESYVFDIAVKLKGIATGLFFLSQRLRYLKLQRGKVEKRRQSAEQNSHSERLVQESSVRHLF